MDNYYEILGLNVHAQPEEVEYAYERLSKQSGTSGDNSPEAVDRTRLINEAYTTLSDDVSREDYDVDHYDDLFEARPSPSERKKMLDELWQKHRNPEPEPQTFDHDGVFRASLKIDWPQEVTWDSDNGVRERSFNEMLSDLTDVEPQFVELLDKFHTEPTEQPDPVNSGEDSDILWRETVLHVPDITGQQILRDNLEKWKEKVEIEEVSLSDAQAAGLDMAEANSEGKFYRIRQKFNSPGTYKFTSEEGHAERSQDVQREMFDDHIKRLIPEQDLEHDYELGELAFNDHGGYGHTVVEAPLYFPDPDDHLIAEEIISDMAHTNTNTEPGRARPMFSKANLRELTDGDRRKFTDLHDDWLGEQESSNPPASSVPDASELPQSQFRPRPIVSEEPPPQLKVPTYDTGFDGGEYSQGAFRRQRTGL